MNNTIVPLLARILLSAIFIMAGMSKMGDIAGTVGYMNAKNIPMASSLAYLVIAAELLGGLAILIGFMTGLASWGLALFCLIAGVIFHLDPTNQTEMIMFMKNLAIAGGFLALSVSGPGSISVDARRR